MSRDSRYEPIQMQSKDIEVRAAFDRAVHTAVPMEQIVSFAAARPTPRILALSGKTAESTKSEKKEKKGIAEGKVDPYTSKYDSGLPPIYKNRIRPLIAAGIAEPKLWKRLAAGFGFSIAVMALPIFAFYTFPVHAPLFMLMFATKTLKVSHADKFAWLSFKFFGVVDSIFSLVTGQARDFTFKKLASDTGNFVGGTIYSTAASVISITKTLARFAGRAIGIK